MGMNIGPCDLLVCKLTMGYIGFVYDMGSYKLYFGKLVLGDTDC